MLTTVLQCRLVHSAHNQCAFVRHNCPDEEAGLLSYLQLYYCRLPKAKPVAFMVLVVWLGLLFSTIGIAASDFFCVDLSTIASVLGMSESMAGVTFLAFGNGSPDVFSTFAAMKTHSGSLAIGELIGAAGFITAVVAGSMALVRPFKVARKSFVRDVGFFIIAASFSMVFLADGHLDLWECAAMVGFYVFYVIIVVLWHWYLKRRSRRRFLEDAARSHFQVPGADDAHIEPYRDEDEEEVGRVDRQPSRTASADDFNNLERASSPLRRPLDEEVDADDETRDRYLAEISNNMRLNRPKRGDRRSTMNPIRPSLVGALEFRAVLSSLQKSRSNQVPPINLRRYSDDPALTLSQAERFSSPASILGMDQQNLQHPGEVRDDANANLVGSRANRIRAKSTNDAEASSQNLDPLQRPPIPQIGTVESADSVEATDSAPESKPAMTVPKINTSLSPMLSLSPADQDSGRLTHSPLPMSPSQGDDLLAPPLDDRSPQVNRTPQSSTGNLSRSPTFPPKTKPSSPRLEIPQSTTSSQKSSPISPFPAYYDDPNFMPSSQRPASIRLPPASADSESAFRQRLYGTADEKPLRWWPYKVLPSPQVLGSTLFPTLYSWREKNLWEKMLGIVAAPSVFLLAITLPVVEVDREEEEVDSKAVPGPATNSAEVSRGRSASIAPVALLPDSPPSTAHSENVSNGQTNVLAESVVARSPAISVTSPPEQSSRILPPAKPSPSQDLGLPSSPASVPPTSLKEWNRWLIIMQVFTGPLFVLLLVHLNTEETAPLIVPILITLICSLTVSILLLLLTSPDRAPKYRYLLCFVGFVVSIAWISTIAGEVVGVLKALGIILNISDAILGLTIFAVGNSLGDLVADITVAKLGYPVMALSACFGGPMLNILLGIGLSGLYMTIRGGERRHAKHPDRPMKYKAFRIEVGGTLLISGIALLVTLLGLLIVVPLRGWWMDRKVGIGLIALWALSTVGNVVVEIVGVGKEI